MESIVLEKKNLSTDYNGTAFVEIPKLEFGYWVIFVVILIIGLIGNILVLHLFRDQTFSISSYPVYLRFLAVSDSIVLIGECTKETLRLFQTPYIIGTNAEVCSISRFIQSLVALSSPWLVVALTMDRFYCVVFPLTRNRLCTRKKANIVCLTILAVSTLVTLPLLGAMEIVEESKACFFKYYIVSYFAAIRLIFTSTLPCLLILLLNIVIVIHIQRSVTFRKRFASSSQQSTEHKLDTSLRPLLLISILAFITLLPLTTSDCVFITVFVLKANAEILANLVKIWPLLTVCYLANFAQNFYILMTSCENYRKILKSRMKCG